MKQYILPALVATGISLGGCSAKYKSSSPTISENTPAQLDNSRRKYTVPHIEGNWIDKKMTKQLSQKTLNIFLENYRQWDVSYRLPYFSEIAERLKKHGLPEKGISVDIGTQPKNVLDEMKQLCHDYLRKTERSHEDFYTVMWHETDKGLERAKKLKFSLMRPDLVRALFSDYEILLVEESIPPNILALYFYPKKGEKLPFFEKITAELGTYYFIIDLGGDGIDASDYTINGLDPEQIPEANRKLTEIVGKYNKIIKNRHKGRTFEDVKSESKIHRSRSDC